MSLVSYLVQRCSSYNLDALAEKKTLLAIEESRTPTIYELLAFDYMGSSEFEWGAIPKAVRTLESQKDFAIKQIPELKNFAGDPVFVYCSSQHFDEIIEFIESLSKMDYRLKEPTYFDHYFAGLRKWHRIDFWFAIDGVGGGFVWSFDESLLQEFVKGLPATISYLNAKKAAGK